MTTKDEIIYCKYYEISRHKIHQLLSDYFERKIIPQNTVQLIIPVLEEGKISRTIKGNIEAFDLSNGFAEDGNGLSPIWHLRLGYFSIANGKVFYNRSAGFDVYEELDFKKGLGIVYSAFNTYMQILKAPDYDAAREKYRLYD